MFGLCFGSILKTLVEMNEQKDYCILSAVERKNFWSPNQGFGKAQ
jgi:hypothetical protein